MRLSFVSGSSITRQRSRSRRGWGLVLRRGVRGGGVAREIDHGLAHARLDRAGFLIACFQGVHDGLDTALRAFGTVAQVRDGLKQTLSPGGLIPLHVGTAAGGGDPPNVEVWGVVLRANRNQPAASDRTGCCTPLHHL